MHPVRILHVIGIMNRGGAENMIMNLYRQIDRSKVQFDFVEHTMDRAAFDDEIVALGGRIYHCPQYKGINHFAYVQWWRDFFAKNAVRYSVVHGHMGRTAATYLSIAKRNGCFTIAHSHSTFQPGIVNLPHRLWGYPTRYVADFFMACSEEAGTSRFGNRVSKSAFYKMLPNGIDTSHFGFNQVLREETRRMLKIEDKIVFGSVGRFVKAKNHTFLLEIFEKIQEQLPNSLLLLVGDGELRKKIEAKSVALGISEKVLFVGIQADVAPYYMAMDVLLMPSLYEGLPLTLVEAQTAGLPCVISNAVSSQSILVPELVEVIRLTSTAEEWAKKTVEKRKISRREQTDQIMKTGFDVKTTAQWLEEFYLEHSK